MNNLRCLGISLIFLSCATENKLTYESTTGIDLERLDRGLEHANYLKSDELWLFLYSGFESTKIQVIENNEIKFDSIISTSTKYPRLATVLKINKHSEVKLHSPSISKPLVIKKGEMLNYKSIYISKRNRHLEVDFSNEIARVRIDESKRNAKSAEKYLRQQIRDSIKLHKQKGN